MARVMAGAALLALLGIQLARVNVPPRYPRVGEKIPFELTRSGTTVGMLDDDCVTAFIVSVTCPHCARLAQSFSGTDGRKGEPLWLVLEGPEAAQDFTEENSLPESLVFSIVNPADTWFFSDRRFSIPFTPLRAILDRNLVIKDLSQSQTIPSGKDRV